MAAEEPDPQALLSALTTEHFTLQGSRSATTSESAARTALYLGAVSSTLIGLGFVSGDRELFRVFALTVLPTVFFLGLVTFVRLVQLGVEDFLYGRAINRIRAYYRELAGPRANLFLMEANDDALGVMRNMGLTPGSRAQIAFTFASAIAVVNSVVGGAATGLLAGVLGAPLGVCVGVGAVWFALSAALHFRYQLQGRRESGGYDESLFPSAPR